MIDDVESADAMHLAIRIDHGVLGIRAETNGPGFVPEVRRAAAREHGIAGAAKSGDGEAAQPFERGEIVGRLDTRSDPVAIEEQSLEPGDALKAEIESFLDCIRTGRAPVVSGEAGLEALETAMRITEQVQESLGHARGEGPVRAGDTKHA